MHRNLDRRVEAAVPITDKKLASFLKDEVLGAYLRDNVNAQILKSDGSYEQIKAESGDAEFDSQQYFVGREI
jgi:polyphosphate kinase